MSFQSENQYIKSVEHIIDQWYASNERVLTTKTIPEGDNTYQRSGIDRYVFLINGKVVTVEEKVRRKWYKDLFFETISNQGAGTPGWAEKDLACDYFVYCCPEENQFKKYVWKQLKSVWDKHKAQWIQVYGIKNAKDGHGAGCCVPFEIIDQAILGETI